MAWWRWASRLLLLVGAALVLAGIVFFFAYNWARMAAWTWMRFSHAWEVTPDEMTPVIAHLEGYVQLRAAKPAAIVEDRSLLLVGSQGLQTGGCIVRLPKPVATSGRWRQVSHSFGNLLVTEVENGSAQESYTGRFVSFQVPSKVSQRRVYATFYGVDTTASRVHGASIAGLVVGAMGVFVFSVALRHWLWERGGFREEARS